MLLARVARQHDLIVTQQSARDKLGARRTSYCILREVELAYRLGSSCCRKIDSSHHWIHDLAEVQLGVIEHEFENGGGDGHQDRGAVFELVAVDLAVPCGATMHELIA